MDGRIVHDNHRLVRDCLTTGIKTCRDNAGVYRLLTHRGMHIIVAIHTSSHIEPSLFHGREFDDFPRGLPRIGNRRIQGKASCITIVQVDLSVVFLFL